MEAECGGGLGRSAEGEEGPSREGEQESIGESRGSGESRLESSESRLSVGEAIL